MRNVCTKIPEAIADNMDRHDIIDQNETICGEIAFIISEREIVESIMEKSTLTSEDVNEIDKKIKKVYLKDLTIMENPKKLKLN